MLPRVLGAGVLGWQAEIKFSTDYRKVPIARVGGDVVKDSSVIVERLQGELRREGGTPAKELDFFFSPDALK